jgi:hypothetical protein
MIAHFVGNGSSRSYFNHQYGTIIVGNIPKEPMQFTACSIIDTKVIDYLVTQNKDLHNQQVWCTQQLADYAKKKNIDGIWHTIYQSQYRYNSGHHAVNHLSQNKHIKIIHLWGMDSMWSEDLTSEMDDRVIRPRRPALNQQWRPHWLTLFSKYDKRYIIHAPKGIKEVDYGAKAKFEYH